MLLVVTLETVNKISKSLLENKIMVLKLVLIGQDSFARLSSMRTIARCVSIVALRS